MTEETTERGFQLVTHPGSNGNPARVVQQSSSALDDRLWVGPNLHLDREEVEQLAGYLECWIATGKLFGVTDRPVVTGDLCTATLLAAGGFGARCSLAAGHDGPHNDEHHGHRWTESE